MTPTPSAILYLLVSIIAIVSALILWFLLPVLGADRPLAVGCPIALVGAGVWYAVQFVKETYA